MEVILWILILIVAILLGCLVTLIDMKKFDDYWIDDIIFDISECGEGFRHGRIYLAVTDDIVSFIDMRMNKEYVYDKRSHSFKECKDQKEKLNIAIENRKYDNLKRWKEKQEE